MGWLFVGAWWWRWRSPGFESVGPLCCLAFSVGQKWRLRKLTRITQQHNCLQEAIQRYSDELKCQRQEYILLSPITHHIREFRKIHHFKTLLNKFQFSFVWTNSPPESPFQTVGHQSHSCKVLLWSRSWHVKHLLVCSQRCLKRNVLNWLEQVVFFYGLQLNNMWREKIEYSI